ncbi:MAG TPA: sialidase family protein [Solirubrobacter sp.]|nr:sialidase family protein [Solirubrobacter sp.]
MGTFKLPAGATKVEEVKTEMSAQGKQGPLNDLVVRFTGPGAVIASGHSRGGTLPQNAGLMRSPDAGKTWESISGLGEIDYHDIEVLTEQNIVALRVDQPDIQVSTDGGKTFEGRAAPAVARAVDITINPNDTKQWAVGTEQGTFISTNEGGSWRQRDTTFGARVSWAPDALYSAGLDGKVRKSTDGGKSFEEVGTIGAGPKDFVAAGDGKLYAYVPGGKIRASQDGGATWTDLTTLF